MAVVGANTTAQNARPRWLYDLILYGVGLIAAASLAWAVAITLASANLKASFEDRISAVEASGQRRLAYAKQRNVQATTDGIAVAIRPLLALRGQVPEINDRTLQSVVGELVSTGRYSFVAIASNDGTVLASSDLALVGRKLTPRPGAFHSPVGDLPPLGTLVLVPRE